MELCCVLSLWALKQWKCYVPFIRHRRIAMFLKKKEERQLIHCYPEEKHWALQATAALSLHCQQHSGSCFWTNGSPWCDKQDFYLSFFLCFQNKLCDFSQYNKQDRLVFFLDCCETAVHCTQSVTDSLKIKRNMDFLFFFFGVFVPLNCSALTQQLWFAFQSKRTLNGGLVLIDLTG